MLVLNILDAESSSRDQGCQHLVSSFSKLRIAEENGGLGGST